MSSNIDWECHEERMKGLLHWNKAVEKTYKNKVYRCQLAVEVLISIIITQADQTILRNL